MYLFKKQLKNHNNLSQSYWWSLEAVRSVVPEEAWELPKTGNHMQPVKTYTAIGRRLQEIMLWIGLLVI